MNLVALLLFYKTNDMCRVNISRVKELSMYVGDSLQTIHYLIYNYNFSGVLYTPLFLHAVAEL